MTPGYFEALGVEVSGRDFSLHDVAESEPVAIVNRSLAQREWPDEDPLGRRIRLGRVGSEEPWFMVVGVVDNLHMGNIEKRDDAGWYRPMAQAGGPLRVAIVARASGEPTVLTDEVRDLVRRLDRSLPVYEVQSMERFIDSHWWLYRLVAWVFSILGVAAAVLAAVGLYSVLAFSVSRRTAEVAVRMALGAAARDVLGLIVRQGLRQVAIGLAVGLPLAAAGANLLSGFVFGVRTHDPATFGAVTVLLVAVGVVAALVPAWRAIRVRPVRALRYE